MRAAGHPFPDNQIVTPLSWSDEFEDPMPLETQCRILLEGCLTWQAPAMQLVVE
jgi:hypothetical protein